MNKENLHPPAWIQRFVCWYCKHEYQDEILGDLEELFERWIDRYSLRKATWLYALHALLFMRLYNLKSIPTNIFTTNTLAMFTNYFKIAYRNIVKEGLYSIIHFVGLTTGLATFLLIFLFPFLCDSH